jgi:hypothetical protein
MSTLRRRILEAMPDILKIIANEKRGMGTGGDGEVRPAVVRSIRKIAELETMTASEERARLVKAAKLLERSKKLLAEARPFSLIRGLDAALTEVEAMRKSKPRGSGRTEANRKRLAAQSACDLLIDLGGVGHMPTLYRDGPYVRLTNLLYNTAVGGDSDLHKICRGHFKALKAEDGDDLYPSNRKWPMPPMPPELKQLVEADLAAYRARNKPSNKY